MRLLWLILIIKACCEILQYDTAFTRSTGILYSFAPPQSGYFTLTIASEYDIGAYLRKDLEATQIYYDIKFIKYIFIPSSFFIQESIYYIFLGSFLPFTYIFRIVYSNIIIDSEYFYFSTISMQQYPFIYKVPSNISEITILANHDINNDNTFVIRRENLFHTDIIANYWVFGKSITINVTSEETLMIIFMSYTSCNYKVLISINNPIIIDSELTYGLTKTKEMSEYILYPTVEKDFLIKLSFFSGQCSLYLKSNSKVSIFEYDQISSNLGSQFLEVNSDSDFFSIGVYCLQDSDYMLSIIYNNYQNTIIMPGYPYIGLLKSYEIDYYKVYMNSGQNISIYLMT